MLHVMRTPYMNDVQVQELQEQLEAKDKEVRAHTLAAQQAQRKLDKIKASAHKAVAGVEARVAEAAAAAEARCRAMEDARVHLMLCIIKEPQAAGGTGRQQQSCRQQQLSLPGSEVGAQALRSDACGCSEHWHAL